MENDLVGLKRAGGGRRAGLKSARAQVGTTSRSDTPVGDRDVAASKTEATAHKKKTSP